MILARHIRNAESSTYSRRTTAKPMARATTQRCVSLVLLASKCAVACRCARTSPNLVSSSRTHFHFRPRWRRRAFSMQARTRVTKQTHCVPRTVGKEAKRVFCRVRHHETIEFSLGLLRGRSFIEQLRRALAGTCKHTGIGEVCHLVGFLFTCFQ